MEKAQKYKPSRYNHFVDTGDGKRLAFNAMSCGLAEIDDENFAVYQALAGGNGDGIDREKHAELIENLKKGGFLVPVDVDELDAIRAGHYQARFGNNGFGLTLIPTYNCNFACDYCYESSEMHSMSPKDGSFMSDEVIDNIVKLCEQRIKPKSAFGVTWYGGEPLLAKGIIGKLTKEFIRICDEKESQYQAGIITNGYLLSKQYVDFLIESRVTFAQVTIDGPREVHDQRRCLKSGGGTFDRIMRNLDNIDDDKGLKVSIRINVDKRNEDRVSELLEDLKRRGMHERKNMSVNFGQVTHYSKSCPDISSSCMNSSDFSHFMVQAFRYAVHLGFQLTIYPHLMISSCGAVSNGSAVIEPNGDVQNCWNTVGDKNKRTGVLTKEGITLSIEYIKWQGWSPFSRKCENCNVLPLCLGGCPYKYIYEKEVTHAKETTCLWWKYNLKPMLEVMKYAKEHNLLPIRNRLCNDTDDRRNQETNVG